MLFFLTKNLYITKRYINKIVIIASASKNLTVVHPHSVTRRLGCQTLALFEFIQQLNFKNLYQFFENWKIYCFIPNDKNKSSSSFLKKLG